MERESYEPAKSSKSPDATLLRETFHLADGLIHHSTKAKDSAKIRKG
jgi:hypothetical protein